MEREMSCSNSEFFWLSSQTNCCKTQRNWETVVAMVAMAVRRKALELAQLVQSDESIRKVSTVNSLTASLISLPRRAASQWNVARRVAGCGNGSCWVGVCGAVLQVVGVREGVAYSRGAVCVSCS